MKNRGRGVRGPRHPCRGRSRELALLCAGALLAGCTTTHTLGRIDDPGVRAEVDAIAASGDAIMHLRQGETHPPPFGDRVTGVTPLGLVIEPTRGQPQLVAREDVRSLSRYSHARGAKDGAIGGGLVSFFAGATLVLVRASIPRSCSDGCGSQNRNAGFLAFEVGTVVGVIGAMFGAGIGALGGHEDRFEISP